MTGFDLLMLPHSEVVNRDEETYVVQGPLTYKTRVTKAKLGYAEVQYKDNESRVFSLFVP